MPELVVALVKIGLPTALGWWVDLSLDESQQKRLRRRLDDWWVKFDDVTWFNFGQQEGLTALRLFDRVFGARLWSWRRWISVAVLLLVINVLVAAILLLGLGGTKIGADHDWPISRFFYIGANVLVHSAGIALSLSVTRWLSQLVLRLPGSYSWLGFAGLLILAALLLTIWAPMLFAIKSVFALLPFIWEPNMRIKDALPFIRGFHKALDYLVPWAIIEREIEQLASKPYVGLGSLLQETANTALALSDLFVGTIRVVFAAFFLACFFLHRFVHRPLSNLGFIWLTSGKPVFAVLFGAIAAAFVFGHELVEMLRFL